jgi:hypothetical protein
MYLRFSSLQLAILKNRREAWERLQTGKYLYNNQYYSVGQSTIIPEEFSEIDFIMRCDDFA